MSSNTREKFIEVAKQLFARKGVENTTMNDIASASDKGRRTIYTYFKSKTDILNAVVESESDRLINQLKQISIRPVQPEQKVAEFVACRIDYMNSIVRKGGKMSWLNMWGGKKNPLIVSREEVSIFADILREGISSATFNTQNPELTAEIATHVIYSMSISRIRENLKEHEISREELKDELINIFLQGL